MVSFPANRGIDVARRSGSGASPKGLAPARSASKRRRDSGSYADELEPFVYRRLRTVAAAVGQHPEERDVLPALDLDLAMRVDNL